MAMTADRPAGFSYDPQPRWQEEPETSEVCEAIEKECAGFLKDGAIDTAFAYAEMYNPDGYLVGLKSLKSTGCKPLDEHMLLSHRHFVTVFSEDDTPDLDNITVEVAPGTDRNAVRLVKTGETQVSSAVSRRYLVATLSDWGFAASRVAGAESFFLSSSAAITLPSRL